MEKLEKGNTAYSVFKGRKIISSHTDYQVLHDRDGKTTYAFYVNYLKIRIPKDWAYINTNLIKKQLEDAGWIVVNNAVNYISSIEIPKDTIMNGKKPNVVNGIRCPKGMFNHLANEELIVCLWPINKKLNTTYERQFELVGYLNSFNPKYVAKYLDCFAVEKSEDVILSLSELIYDNYKEVLPIDLKEYLEELPSNLDRGTAITLK